MKFSVWRVPKSTVLVYPRNTKYELAFEQPYIEMMSAFQAAIRQPETALLVVGFGFNDNHLAEPIPFRHSLQSESESCYL
jgi:homogentisate 1,2-dioxygenase